MTSLRLILALSAPDVFHIALLIVIDGLKHFKRLRARAIFRRAITSLIQFINESCWHVFLLAQKCILFNSLHSVIEIALANLISYSLDLINIVIFSAGVDGGVA